MCNSDSHDQPPVIDAGDIASFIAPEAPENTELSFGISCYSKGITPELALTGYSMGAFPWPDEEDIVRGLYPWGRLFPCTVLPTSEIHLSHSLKKTVRDALASHYKGQRLNIYMDLDFDSTMDAIVQYHEKGGGTWITQEMLSVWKDLHRRGNAHTVSVYVEDTLVGGLYFTSVGRMLYGESMFSRLPDVSKLALVALCAFAKLTHHPAVDCQMATDHVLGMGALPMHGKNFLTMNRILSSADPFDWSRAAGLDLIPFLKAAFPNLKPRPAPEETPCFKKEIVNNIILTLASVDVPCNYFDNRQSTMEIIPIPNDQPEFGFIYNYVIGSGFRRDSTIIYRLACKNCRRCIPTRIDVTTFRPDKTMRRIFNKNADLIMKELPLSEITDEQYDLYVRYQNARHKDGAMGKMTKEEVSHVLFRTCSDSRLLEFRLPEDSENPNRLVMVCIMDRLDDSISAVYNFYDPDMPKASLGTYGILSEIEYARDNGLRYVYLGYWLPGYPGMDYKTRYQPLDIFWDGSWIPEQSFEPDFPADSH